MSTTYDLFYIKLYLVIDQYLSMFGRYIVHDGIDFDGGVVGSDDLLSVDGKICVMTATFLPNIRHNAKNNGQNSWSTY